jgi:hypothetical protein
MFKPIAIQAEFVLVYGPDAFARTMVTKWHKCFHKGRMDLVDVLRPGMPLTDNFAEAIRSMFAE